MEHKIVRGFELGSFLGDDSDIAFNLMFEPVAGEKLMLSMPRTIAAAIAEQVTAALIQLAREGVETETPAAPELILSYNAVPVDTVRGPAVAIVLEGDRSRQRFYGLQNQTDARRFAGLLSAAAESSGPKRPN